MMDNVPEQRDLKVSYRLVECLGKCPHRALPYVSMLPFLKLEEFPFKNVIRLSRKDILEYEFSRCNDNDADRLMSILKRTKQGTALRLAVLEVLENLLKREVLEQLF
jgi:hypothetical protein